MYGNLEAVGTFLVVQWLGLHASTVGGTVSTLGYLQKKKKKKENYYFFLKNLLFLNQFLRNSKIDSYLQMMSLINFRLMGGNFFLKKKDLSMHLTLILPKC